MKKVLIGLVVVGLIASMSFIAYGMTVNSTNVANAVDVIMAAQDNRVINTTAGEQEAWINVFNNPDNFTATPVDLKTAYQSAVTDVATALTNLTNELGISDQSTIPDPETDTAAFKALVDKIILAQGSDSDKALDLKDTLDRRLNTLLTTSTAMAVNAQGNALNEDEIAQINAQKRALVENAL